MTNSRKKYPLSLHIFRRDLRLHDNTALIEALNQSDQVIPCFVFDTRQIKDNPYQSANTLEFMQYSLIELNKELQKKQSKLYFFYGISEEIIKTLISSLPIRALFINRDYTPFSKVRDGEIEKICQQYQIDYHCYADALLHEPEEVLKNNGKPYTIFTPYLKHASTLRVSAPTQNKHHHYFNRDISIENDKPLKTLFKNSNPHILLQGGRAEAKNLLKKIHQLKDYDTIRNYPAQSATTKLSAHLKFGTLSVREFYEAVCQTFSKQHQLINELYWRDFFTHIAYHFPHVFGGSFHQKYNQIAWRENKSDFQRWCQGTTGFPIVDAGMRELNTTGYMHNRVRMIVASFFVKDLHLDWREGEKYFANQLIDYDPAVNNGNWQWAASTGCDAQPYFRIFNPWLQQAKFDPDCLYIKRWVPELAALSSKAIHSLYQESKVAANKYPLPMINHAIESKKAKLLFQKCQLNE